MSQPVRQRGFTLIELIVVIALLGLVMAYVAPELFSKADEAKHRAAGIQVEKVNSTVELYKLETGRFPTELQDLVRQPAGMSNWKGPYLKKKLLIDPWNNELIYTQPGEHGRFDLVSLGSDGEPGGEAENADINNWD